MLPGERQDRDWFPGVPGPFWGTTMECTFVEPCLVLPGPILGSQHLPGAQCPCSLAKQPAQHCIPFKLLLSIWPKLSYTGWLKPLPTSYLTVYAVALPLSLKGTYFFIQGKKKRFITLAMESYHNRPVKIAKVVATLPSNYTCDKFIYLLVQQLNLHPHFTANSGSALHCNRSRDSKGWTLLKENPL